MTVWITRTSRGLNERSAALPSPPVVAAIPYGRVTTYGDNRRAAGWAGRAPRLAGSFQARRTWTCPFIEWSIGTVISAEAGHSDTPIVMRSSCCRKRRRFVGEYTVDLKRCLWEPATTQPPPTKWTTSSTSPAWMIDFGEL